MHSNKPNKNTKRTWRCKCGLINVPEASECKGILMQAQGRQTSRSIKITPGWKSHKQVKDKAAIAKAQLEDSLGYKFPSESDPDVDYWRDFFFFLD